MTIQHRFEIIKEKYPLWGDIPAFEESLLPEDSDASIYLAFDEVVDKTEYRPSEKEGILDWLVKSKGIGRTKARDL